VKVLDINVNEQRISLSIRELEEPEQEEDYSQYSHSEDSGGFQLGEMIGDKLKKLKK
jgi:small subunit ribosomal protein S1